MTRTRLSELECFVLGLIWQRPRSTAYDIRRRLEESPSTQWSASAGAIYPLVQKLERARHLSGRDRRTGRRARREFIVTAKGLRALRAWIGPPLPRDAVTVTHDPLRSRARFLSLLDPAERGAWVGHARDALGEVERRVHEWRDAHAGGSDPYADLLTAHAVLDLEFRRRWLDLVERAPERA